MRAILVGTNHADQMHGYEKGEYQQFTIFLRDLIALEKPDLLAEEMSKPALLHWRVQDSVLELIAKEMKLAHVFCDPTQEERDSLEIPRDDSETLVTARESFWLKKVKEQSCSKFIFVLGEKHVNSFGSILKLNNIDVHREIGAWRPNKAV